MSSDEVVLEGQLPKELSTSLPPKQTEESQYPPQHENPPTQYPLQKRGVLVQQKKIDAVWGGGWLTFRAARSVSR